MCACMRLQLKELEKLGPKMKGIGDYIFHGFFLLSHARFVC